MKVRRLIKDFHDLIVARLDQGVSAYQIAKDLEFTYQSMKQYCKANELQSLRMQTITIDDREVYREMWNESARKESELDKAEERWTELLRKARR